jgi:hypothetical protein
VPQLETPDHHTRLALIMFQAGRTATTATHQDHLANQFGKAIMRKSFERESNKEMLEYLDRVNISMTDGVIDAICQHLAMCPLIAILTLRCSKITARKTSNERSSRRSLQQPACAVITVCCKCRIRLEGHSHSSAAFAPHPADEQV